MHMPITKDMLIGDIIEGHPEAVNVFESHGMCCGSCMGAHGETVEVSARMHGIEVKRLLDELNELISADK